MVKSDIQILNEMYQNITSPTNSIKAIWSEFRRGGEAKTFNLTPTQAALFSGGIKSTLEGWAKHGTGEVAPELETFVQEMKTAMGYRPGIDAENLTIDITPEGNAGGVGLNDEEAITFLDSSELDYLDGADSETLLGIVDDISARSKTIMFSPEIPEFEGIY